VALTSINTNRDRHKILNIFETINIYIRLNRSQLNPQMLNL